MLIRTLLSDLKVIFGLFRFTFPDFRIPCVFYDQSNRQLVVVGFLLLHVVNACVYNLNKVAF